MLYPVPWRDSFSGVTEQTPLLGGESVMAAGAGPAPRHGQACREDDAGPCRTRRHQGDHAMAIRGSDAARRIGSAIVREVRGLARIATVRSAARRLARPDAVLAERVSEGLLWQLIAFAVIGVASTLATAALYALLRSWAPPLVANLVALIGVNLLNTEANRR